MEGSRLPYDLYIFLIPHLRGREAFLLINSCQRLHASFSAIDRRMLAFEGRLSRPTPNDGRIVENEKAYVQCPDCGLMVKKRNFRNHKTRPGKCSGHMLLNSESVYCEHCCRFINKRRRRGGYHLKKRCCPFRADFCMHCRENRALEYQHFEKCVGIDKACDDCGVFLPQRFQAVLHRRYQCPHSTWLCDECNKQCQHCFNICVSAAARGVMFVDEEGHIPSMISEKNMIVKDSHYILCLFREPGYILWSPSRQFQVPRHCTYCCSTRGSLPACGRCHQVYYCSRQCQRKDYKRHQVVECIE